MPDLLLQLQKLAVIGFLVGSMAAMGLTLTPAAVAAPLRNGRRVILALALNFVFAPAFAFVLTKIIPLDRGHAIGLILLSAAAGAPFLPKLVVNARGDLALAGALTGLLTVGTILFLPLALPRMIPGLPIDAWSIAKPLLLLIILPCIAGMGIKGAATLLADRLAPIVGMIGNVCLLLLFALLVALNMRALLGVIGSGAIFAALLYIVGLLVAGWLLGGARKEVRSVVALSTAARNFGAALAPAGALGIPNVTTMLIVSAIVCLLVTFLAAGWMRRGAGQPAT